MKKARTLYLAGVALLALATGSHAQDVDANGAAAMQKALVGFLPKVAADTGFVTVDPEGAAYKVKVDFGKLAAGLAPHDVDLSINGIFDLLVSPPGADGLYAVKRDASDLSFTGKWNKGEEKGDFSYVLKDFTMDGQWDQAIPYFRTAVSHATGGTMSVKDTLSDVQASFGPIDQTLSSNANADGSVDILGKSTMAGIRETVRGKDQPEFVMSFGNMDVDANLKGLRLKEIKDLIGFIAGHTEGEKLKPEEQKALIELAQKAMPVLSNLEETVVAKDASFASSGVEGKLAEFRYNLGMAGFSDNSELHFGIGFSKPSISGLPQAEPYADLVPQEMDLTMAIPGLNFVTALDYFVKNGDFTKDEPLTKEQGDEMSKVFLTGGKLDISIPSFTATSPLYNITVTGHMATEVLSQPVKATAEFDVTAKELDKTIAGIQELAQKVPDLNTASFGLMMAKGMAKSDPDGTAHWKIEVDENNVVKINGQEMPH